GGRRGGEYFRAGPARGPESFPEGVDFCGTTKTAPIAMEGEPAARLVRAATVGARCRNTKQSMSESPPALILALACWSAVKAKPARGAALRAIFTSLPTSPRIRNPPAS